MEHETFLGQLKYRHGHVFPIETCPCPNDRPLNTVILNTFFGGRAHDGLLLNFFADKCPTVPEVILFDR